MIQSISDPWDPVPMIFTNGRWTQKCASFFLFFCSFYTIYSKPKKILKRSWPPSVCFVGSFCSIFFGEQGTGTVRVAGWFLTQTSRHWDPKMRPRSGLQKVSNQVCFRPDDAGNGRKEWGVIGSLRGYHIPSLPGTLFGKTRESKFFNQGIWAGFTQIDISPNWSWNDQDLFMR